STRLVGPAEWALLLVSLPVWALLAQLVWLVFPGRGDAFGWEGNIWRLLGPVWLLAAVLFLAGGFFGFLRRGCMRPEEGQLYLQDVLWQETRREQRWLTRWLAWDRLRRLRRDKKA